MEGIHKMPGLAVIVAVMDGASILLTKREDFEVWCLPGGGVEDGETAAEAAAREAKEETGLDVKLTRLVGIYSRMGGGMRDTHAILYAAQPVGGELQTQPGETIDVAYFPFDQLPGELLLGHKKRIHDAIHGLSGMSVRQEIKLEDATIYTRQELYAMRDRSGLSRQQFYSQRFEEAEFKEVVEVGQQ
jgi:ADP-ribose pyrophosphatase YjhB (NUDIX family)